MWKILQVEGRRRRVALARSPQGVWVGLDGAAHLVTPPAARGAAAVDAGADSGEVRAPMTGRVVQVTVQVGDKVSRGDGVVVLEAMKMEYRLAAPRDGQVASVACKPGDLVDLGATVITLTA